MHLVPHFGVYKFKSLAFGLQQAPEYFQNNNEEHFGDIEGLVIFNDDFVISGSTLVLERDVKLNVKFNQKKVHYR